MKALKLCSTVLILASAAQASIISYQVSLSGPGESPPNASPGTGSALVTINTTTNMMEVDIFGFSGLLGTTSASHIHCCTAVPLTGTGGVATTTPSFPGFPLGVTSGSYDMVFDLTNATSYNPAFVTSSGGTVAQAESALLAGMAAGETYLNIHTSVVPGGEIRGFLLPTPEPGTLVLSAFAMAALALKRRR